jgi:hypothetical protein
VPRQGKARPFWTAETVRQAVLMLPAETGRNGLPSPPSQRGLDAETFLWASPAARTRPPQASARRWCRVPAPPRGSFRHHGASPRTLRPKKTTDTVQSAYTAWQRRRCAEHSGLGGDHPTVRGASPSPMFLLRALASRLLHRRSTAAHCESPPASRPTWVPP